MSDHHENKSQHGNDHHMSPSNNRTNRIKRFMITTPMIYPLIRVQTLMQSHLTFPVGETLPNFRKSFQLAIGEGGLYKGFSFFFLYSSGVYAGFSYHPLLGIAITGLLYPLELMQIYFASNGVNPFKLVETVKKTGLLTPYYYRGSLLNFFSNSPFLFFLNNIKRNYVLRTDEGVKTNYREVLTSFGRDPQKLLRGGVPALLNFLIVATISYL
jgi:hypothetical protein